MKLKVKASQAFKKLKTGEKPAFGTGVLNGLDNSIFANLPVSLSELTIINSGLSLAVTNSLTGSHVAAAALKTAVATWDDAFGRTAVYVSTLANGDAEIVRLAGFVPTKSESTPKQKPGAITGFDATINGSKGTIIAGSKYSVALAEAFMFCVIPEGVTVTYSGDVTILTVGETSIYLSASKSRQTESHDLPSHTPFNVSMYAINSAGSGPATTAKQVTPQ